MSESLGQQTASNPLHELAEREKLIDLLNSDVIRFVLEKHSKSTVEHILMRFGFRVEGAQGINDLQEDMAFLRSMRKNWEAFEARMAGLETAMIEQKKEQIKHEEICGERWKNVLDAQMQSAADRKEIKRDLRVAISILLATLLSVVAYLLDKFVFITIGP